jgi:hypothetical protein
MMRWFGNLIYGAAPKEFLSSFGLEESVQRLSAATGRSIFSSFTSQMAVGKVTQSQVRLQRTIPMVGNGFKPFFIGSFVSEGGRVVLKGRFTMSIYSKIFISIWFGFLACWTVLALLVFLIRDPGAWWLPLFGVGMFAFGIALVRGCQWLARNDAAWLSRVIDKALSGNAPPDSLSQGDAPQAARA